jgi:hypothetical protein
VAGRAPGRGGGVSTAGERISAPASSGPATARRGRRGLAGPPPFGLTVGRPGGVLAA